MIQEKLVNVKPFIVHGTDVSNIISILENGLWSQGTLKEKNINPEWFQIPYVQNRNKYLFTNSVWVYNTDKEEWSNKEERAVRIGTLSTEERIQIITGTAALPIGCHIAYDFCFVFPPHWKVIKPDFQNFAYEAFIEDTGILTSQNCLAVVVNEKKLIEDAFGEDAIKWRNAVMQQVESELKKRKIPFIKDGWGEKDWDKELDG
ncbi:hypothetical protein J4227_07170 [Candidatus Woesearchaeota archaeon]|nr:hypothetical protein [Candidatus Woesearchaeota archaeon]